MRRRALSGFAVLAAALVATAGVGARGGAAPAPAKGWTIRTLPTLGGSLSRAFAINERGQAAGGSTVAGGATHAVLWSASGKATDLHTLGGASSSADDVNNKGQVTGSSATAGGPTHAFFWSAGRSRDLGTLGGASSFGHAVNDAGLVAGFSQTANGSGHGFSWTAKGGPRDLGTLGGSLSFALAVNSFGTIVGASDLPDSARSAPVAWRSASPSSLGLPSEFDYGFAYGVNFTGQATGSLETNDGADAFLWHGGTLDDLGRLGDFRYTRGLGINSASEVVGVAFETLGGATRAFIWRGGTMSDLNTVLPATTHWSLQTAEDVNDLGQIAGYGLLDGATRGYVLTPPLAQQVASLIPFVASLEPGTTAFERKAVAALNGSLKGRKGCAGLRAAVKAAAKEKKLGAVRRNAFLVRMNALARNAGCG